MTDGQAGSRRHGAKEEEKEEDMAELAGSCLQFTETNTYVFV